MGAGLSTSGRAQTFRIRPLNKGGLAVVGLAKLGSARAGFTAHSLAGKPRRFANLSAAVWRGRDLGSVSQIAFNRCRPRSRLVRHRPDVRAGGCGDRKNVTLGT